MWITEIYKKKKLFKEIKSHIITDILLIVSVQDISKVH